MPVASALCGPVRLSLRRVLSVVDHSYRNFLTRSGNGLGGRTVEPGSVGFVLVQGFHGVSAGMANGQLAFGGVGRGFGLDMAGGDGVDEVGGFADDLAFAVFGDHLVKVGLRGFELLHLGIELSVGGFDVGVIGVVDHGFRSSDEGVAENGVVVLGWQLGQKENRG